MTPGRRNQGPLAAGRLALLACVLALPLPALAQTADVGVPTIPGAGDGGPALPNLLSGDSSASGASVPAIRNQTINDSTELINNPTLLTITLNDADIRQLLTKMAQMGGMNVMLDDSVQGRVTLSLKAVPLNQALDLVLRMHDLEAKRIGSTLLIATREVFEKKEYGGVETVLLRIDNSKVTDIVAKVKQAIIDSSNEKQVKIIPDQRTNSLLITAPEDVVNRAKALIQALDIPTPQVLISVKMVELSKGDQAQLGLHYGFGGSKFGASWDNQNPDTLAGGTGNQAGNPATGTGATSITFNALGNYTANFNARLDWAIQHNYATVLADPQVAAQDNKTATITIANRHPIIQTAVDSVGHAYSSVGFVDVGQSLTITPRIDTKGYVTLNLNPTISADSGDVIVDGNPVPIIDSRSVQTTMRVRDGESIIIGGLESKNTTSSVEKMPILGDIPILGRLFQTTTQSEDDSEILIEVTPHITTRLAPSEQELPGLGGM